MEEEIKVIFLKKILLKYGMIIVILVILWIVCIPFSFMFVFNQKPNSKKIIQHFKENEELFNLSMQELLTEDRTQIVFSYELDTIDAMIFLEQDNNLVEKVKLKNSDIEKYPNTVKLIKTLNIRSVSSDGYDIKYLCHSQIGLSQHIAYLSDEKENIYKELSYKQKVIKNNWYYVELY